jgi:multidrug efflux pump subunit AcrA (membrane-fusion protein)
LLPVAAVVVLIWWAYQRRNEPPQVPFAKARRETLTSALNTNGKVEPIESEAVRAEKAGLIEKILVQPGDTVAAGAVLARLDETGLEADLQAAQARLAQARADLATIEAGGRGSELASIESSLARARFDRDQAQRE